MMIEREREDVNDLNRKKEKVTEKERTEIRRGNTNVSKVKGKMRKEGNT